jgi:hypothetical protein
MEENTTNEKQEKEPVDDIQIVKKNGEIWFHVIEHSYYYDVMKRVDYVNNIVFKNSDIGFIETKVNERKVETCIHVKNTKVGLPAKLGERFIKIFKMINCSVEIESEKK